MNGNIGGVTHRPLVFIEDVYRADWTFLTQSTLQKQPKSFSSKEVDHVSNWTSTQ